MIICNQKQNGKVIPTAGRLYRILNLSATNIYIYCAGKQLFVNLEQGSFAAYQKEDEFLDVTELYCLKEIGE